MSVKGAFIKTAWLDAATSPQATAAEDVSGASSYGVQAVITGSPSAVVLKLQGSVDGSNWVDLIIRSGTGDGISFGVDMPVRYARLNLTTLTGGSSPTVTGSLIAI